MGKRKDLYHHLRLALAGMNYGVQVGCFGDLQIGLRNAQKHMKD
jgi:hypothetical protein